MPNEVAFFDKFKLDLKTLWNEHRVFLIIFGILIIIVKFRDIFIDLIVSNGKKDIANTFKKDDSIKSEENTLNFEANDLVKESKTLPDNQKPVDLDWNKKK